MKTWLTRNPAYDIPGAAGPPAAAALQGAAPQPQPQPEAGPLPGQLADAMFDPEPGPADVELLNYFGFYSDR